MASIRSYLPFRPSSTTRTTACQQVPEASPPCPSKSTSSGAVILAEQEQEEQQIVSSQRPPASFLTLPPEIHLLISQQLIYPDALSLKHTSRYFYGLVDTGVELKIDWLVERRRLHLECPTNHRGGCDLGSDLRFCRGSVSLLMQRRREHVECESRPGLGCLVYGTSRCNHPPKVGTRLRRWLRIEFTVDLRWVLLALVPVLIAWLCMTLFV
ncbi:hypothetical protein B0H66DRAFT_603572 [Apodospora peruviana]|uniref:F-box domain-containing protein n=1 Tax=Apodospora peruviana TaxID=516989 RepID=A0AAE0I5T8_9PEZI|nr:hypothetical protein B0H66DRAFT_603572 [Apodospora peruviana]